MEKKSYKVPKSVPTRVGEPAVAYRSAAVEISSVDKWNPNVPFYGTQEEWWAHFHRIEEGGFTPLEEANREFEEWKREYLANRLK